MFVKCVPRRSTGNEGNEGICRVGRYTDWLWICTVNVVPLVENTECTSETELSKRVSETSQDARVVMPKNSALRMVGNWVKNKASV